MIEEGMSTAYLGDGVYVAIDSGDVVLTTSDGRSVTNLIVLEPSSGAVAWPSSRLAGRWMQSSRPPTIVDPPCLRAGQTARRSPEGPHDRSET
jgi:hypothetical protein